MQEPINSAARLAFGLLCGIFSFAGTLEAAPVTFDFTGMVTRYEFSEGDPSDPFGGTVSPGTGITGQYTFDSEAPDTETATNLGSYDHSGIGLSFSVDVGGNEFQDDLENITVWFDNALSSAEGYQVSSDAYFTTEPGFRLTLSNENQQGAIESDTLPLFPLDPANFDTSVLVISEFFVPSGEMFPTGIDFSIEGELQTLTLALPVPLPKSLLFLLSGLSVLAFTCKRGQYPLPSSLRGRPRLAWPTRFPKASSTCA